MYTVKVNNEVVAKFLHYSDAEDYAISVSNEMKNGKIKKESVEIAYIN